MAKSIYPTAEQLVDGVIWPCSRVPRLVKAGLRGYELLVRFVWVEQEDPDEDEDDYEPDIEVSIRKGPLLSASISKIEQWTDLGLVCDRLELGSVPCGTMALVKYLNDLEHNRMSKIGDLCEKGLVLMPEDM
jgi:hypothetical protein